MGEGSEESDELDEKLLEKFYYFHLWKGRLAYTKHQIPFRAMDSETGFFMECLIKAPPQIKSIYQEIECTLALNPLFFNPELIVRMDCIYPSARNLTKIQDGKLTLVETPMEFYPATNREFTSNSLEYFFSCYPKQAFTINEIEVAFNNKMPEYLKEKLVKAAPRICIIDSKLSDSYVGIEIQSSIMLPSQKEDKKMTHEFCQGLLDLYKQYKNCTLCNLGQERQTRNIPTVVPSRIGLVAVTKYSSPIPANMVAFIGEAPGRLEEEFNMPFHPGAPAGGVLDKVIQASGLNIDNCFFTNAVICRPTSDSPGSENGKPTIENIKVCNSRLKNEIAIVKPSVVVLLGRIAYISFFGTEPRNVLKLTGWLDEEQTIYFMPHPSYIVRELAASPEATKSVIKAKYLSYFQSVKDKYDLIVNSK